VQTTFIITVSQLAHTRAVSSLAERLRFIRVDIGGSRYNDRQTKPSIKVRCTAEPMSTIGVTL